jgi:hypothetical protein
MDVAPTQFAHQELCSNGSLSLLAQALLARTALLSKAALLALSALNLRQAARVVVVGQVALRPVLGVLVGQAEDLVVIKHRQQANRIHLKHLCPHT